MSRDSIYCMMEPAKRDENTLYTSAGDFPLNEYRLRREGREWKIMHLGSVLSQAQEHEFLLGLGDKLPYGVTLWTASIALAHEIAARGDFFKGAKILELGAGTGLPGIVAASFGATVLQTDRNELALILSKRNQELNGVENIEQRIGDWTEWNDAELYDLIIGSDILYSKEMHPHLKRIFESNLARSGRLLLSDPFRLTGVQFLEQLEDEGWTVKLNKWTIGEETSPRAVGVFELLPK